MNFVGLVGRLTSDPEVKKTSNGASFVKFNIGVDRALSKEQREKFEEKHKNTADFPRIVAYGKVAENVCEYLSKGSLVSVSGCIRTENFENSKGEMIYLTEVVADKVGFLDNKNHNTNKKEEISVEVHDDL